MIKLVMTCSACPEQYDAYDGDRQVGYLRLRHGYFTVECPDVSGNLVYHAEPEGDGSFEPEERDYYLRFAVKAIQDWVAGKKFRPEPPDVNFFVEGGK